MTINKEGSNTIVIVALVAVLATVVTNRLNAPDWLFWIVVAGFLVVLVLVISFFRDPERNTPLDEILVYSPADGKVVIIEEVYEKEFLRERCIQISVFMSMTNVHVNRYPVGGRVVYTKYHAGLHAVAWHPKSSEKNERMTTAVESPRGVVVFRQIAGFVARRIVSYAREGDNAVQGDRYGMIKLGSRLDIFVPLGSGVLVSLGDNVHAGESPIAKFT